MDRIERNLIIQGFGDKKVCKRYAHKIKKVCTQKSMQV